METIYSVIIVSKNMSIYFAYIIKVTSVRKIISLSKTLVFITHPITILPGGKSVTIKVLLFSRVVISVSIASCHLGF